MEYERRDYFRDRFSPDELRELLSSMGVTPRDVLSTRSRAYEARKDEIDSLTDDELVEEMTAEPTLLRRPLLVDGDTYLVGAKKSELEQFVQETQR